MREDGLERRPERSRGRARPEREEHDPPAIEERGERVALLGREPGGVVEDDAERPVEVLDAIGHGGERPHVGVELERRERLLDDGRAAGRHGLGRRVGHDGDRAAARLGDHGRHVVGGDGVARRRGGARAGFASSDGSSTVTSPADCATSAWPSDAARPRLRP